MLAVPEVTATVYGVVFKLIADVGTASVKAPLLVLLLAVSPAGVTFVKVTAQVVELPAPTVVGLHDVPVPPVKATLPAKLPLASTATVKGATESMVALLGGVTLREYGSMTV
jgi:hypothetical protein